MSYNGFSGQRDCLVTRTQESKDIDSINISHSMQRKLYISLHPSFMHLKCTCAMILNSPTGVLLKSKRPHFFQLDHVRHPEHFLETAAKYLHLTLG